jgi:HK97 family phage major capsid protein
MPDPITIDQLSSRLDDALGELKKVRELREREEQARLAAKPSPVSVDATVPATAADPDEKLYEERVREAQARSPAGLPPKDKFSFVRFFRAQMAHNPALAPYEMRCFAASQKKFDSLHEKAIGWASGSSGGYWIGSEFLPEEFVAHFRAALVCAKAGMRILPCTGAPVQIPMTTASGTVYWLAQNATITESSPTPGQLSLTPKFAANRVQLSKFLVNTSSGAAEQIVREDMSQALAVAIDAAVLEGSPTTASPCPTGIENTSSINNVDIGSNGGALTQALLDDMIYELDVDNVPQDGRAFIMHPRTWHNITQFIKGSTANDFVYAPDGSYTQPNVQGAPAMRIRGIPVFLSTNVSIAETKGTGTALANVYLARMTDVILAEWGGVELAATDVGGNAWAQNAVEIRATYACDVGVRNANSICLIDDSTS